MANQRENEPSVEPLTNISIINLIMNQMKPIENLITEKKRNQIATTCMLSRLKYGLPQFFGETKKMKNHIQQPSMKLIILCIKEATTSRSQSYQFAAP